MAGDYCVGQHNYRAFLSLQKILSNSAAFELYSHPLDKNIDYVMFIKYQQKYVRIFFLFMAAPVEVCGSSQARVKAHGNTRSELHLRPMLQLLATPDP